MRPKTTYDREYYDEILTEQERRVRDFEAVIDRLEEVIGWEPYKDPNIEDGLELVLESVDNPEMKLRIRTYYAEYEDEDGDEHKGEGESEPEYRKYYSLFSSWGCGEDGRYVWEWSREGYADDRIFGAPTVMAEYVPLAEFLHTSRVSLDPFVEWEVRRQLWKTGFYATYTGPLVIEREWQTP